ncbi:MAG: hypothetical protein HY906_13820 [Deltaproteobacteria bacterium]|nr:hypothetical protein [Deltaproteobacteria bacterium]
MTGVRIADAGAVADEVHQECQGGADWYVGTASDPRHRLALLHNVDLEAGRYVIVKCTEAGVALAAARLLRDEHGYQGAPGSGGPDCVYLYVYAVTADTRQLG